MYYFANIIVLIICVAIPIYWEGWHEGFCKVEFLCYMSEPNWLGYIVFYSAFFVLWWVFAFWKGFRKRNKEDDRKT